MSQERAVVLKARKVGILEEAAHARFGHAPGVSVTNAQMHLMFQNNSAQMQQMLQNNNAELQQAIAANTAELQQITQSMQQMQNTIIRIGQEQSRAYNHGRRREHDQLYHISNAAGQFNQLFPQTLRDAHSSASFCLP